VWARRIDTIPFDEARASPSSTVVPYVSLGIAAGVAVDDEKAREDRCRGAGPRAQMSGSADRARCGQHTCSACSR